MAQKILEKSTKNSEATRFQVLESFMEEETQFVSKNDNEGNKSSPKVVLPDPTFESKFLELGSSQKTNTKGYWAYKKNRGL